MKVPEAIINRNQTIHEKEFLIMQNSWVFQNRLTKEQFEKLTGAKRGETRKEMSLAGRARPRPI